MSDDVVVSVSWSADVSWVWLDPGNSMYVCAQYKKKVMFAIRMQEHSNAGASSIWVLTIPHKHLALLTEQINSLQTDLILWIPTAVPDFNQNMLVDYMLDLRWISSI